MMTTSRHFPNARSECFFSGDVLTLFPVASGPLTRRDEDSNIRDNEWNKERNDDFRPNGRGRLAPEDFVKVIDREEYRPHDERDEQGPFQIWSIHNDAQCLVPVRPCRLRHN